MTTFVQDVVAIDLTVDAERCDDAELSSLSCKPCTHQTLCGIGSSCVKGLCTRNCGGHLDASCPIEQRCTPFYKNQYSVLNFCQPSSQLQPVCEDALRFRVQCTSPRLLQSNRPNKLTFALESPNSTVAIGEATVVKYADAACTSDEACADGELCSVDRCVDGLCVYTYSSACQTTLPSVKGIASPLKTIGFVQSQRGEDQQAFVDHMLQSGSNFGLFRSSSPEQLRVNDAGLSYRFFGVRARALAINPNGALVLPPFMPCKDYVGSKRCLTYSSISNVVSVWSSSWSDYILDTSAIRYLSTPNVSFSVLYKDLIQLETDVSGSTFGVTIYADGTVTLRYIKVSHTIEAEDTAGLWSNKVSEDEESRRRSSLYELPSEVIKSGSDVTLCTFSALACPLDACVSPGELLVLAWPGLSCAVTPTYSCSWQSGLVKTVPILDVDSEGKVASISCPVPTLNVTDGTVVSVTVALSSPFDSAISFNGESLDLMAMTFANKELSKHNIRLRYYAQDSPVCGCSALGDLGTLSCDACRVCGGSKTTVDCNGDCFGSAYKYYNDTCMGGLTDRFPTFIDDYPVIRPWTDELYNLISLVVLVCFFFMMLLVLCLCLRIIILGNPSANDNDMVVIAFNVADTLGIRRLVLTDQHLQEIGQFEYPKSARQSQIDPEQSQSTEDCSICLCDFVDGEMCRELPAPCGHVFHKKCIDEWFGTQRATCPNCKRSIYRILMERDSIPEVGPSDGNIRVVGRGQGAAYTRQRASVQQQDSMDV